MSLSATWQHLPSHLLWPLLDGALTLAEASELWDLMLVTPPGGATEIPPRLWPALDRLNLWLQPAESTLH